MEDHLSLRVRPLSNWSGALSDLLPDIMMAWIQTSYPLAGLRVASSQELPVTRPGCQPCCSLPLVCAHARLLHVASSAWLL